MQNYCFYYFCHYFRIRNRQKESFMYNNSLYILNNLNLVVLRR